ncbi:MAG: FAD-dependent oxidoreductase [Bacillus sp. (in: firmicutes)]
MTSKHPLPRYPESYWIASSQKEIQGRGENPDTADTVIVGAGITGITLAYLLTQRGQKVILLDAGAIYNGTTGHTTAKLTAQHGLKYAQLIKESGEEKARQYYRANQEAMDFVIHLIGEHKIDCDFSRQDAYVYTNEESYIEKLDSERKAYETLGIRGEVVKEIPVPIPCKAAIKMKNQAQFHPVKYLNRLVDIILAKGGVILENTVAIGIENEPAPTVILKDGRSIKAKDIVVASHFPFTNFKGGYFSRLHPERSYVVAATSPIPYPGGMYINAESPSRSLRSAKNEDGSELWLIGGANHQTGEVKETFECYEELKAYGEQHFDITSIPYRWSAQDLSTLDSIPYVGRQTKHEKHIFVATGYAKWGMTNGTAAALLLKDLITGKPNGYTDLYSPSRINANPAVLNFAKQNIDVAKHFIKGKLEAVQANIHDIPAGEAAVVSVNGNKTGCYRDKGGKIHAVDTTCTHMGCEVEWNNGEKTWDCPCHGSRFSYEGDVVEGPATEALKKVDLT